METMHTEPSHDGTPVLIPFTETSFILVRADELAQRYALAEILRAAGYTPILHEWLEYGRFKSEQGTICVVQGLGIVDACGKNTGPLIELLSSLCEPGFLRLSDQTSEEAMQHLRARVDEGWDL